MQKVFVDRIVSWVWVVLAGCSAVALGAEPTVEPARRLRFAAASPEEARAWQVQARDRLWQLLMGGERPAAIAADPQVLRRVEVPAGGYVLEEVSLRTWADRRVHAWLARPAQPRGRVGVVLALHGHGGTGEEIVRGLSLYGYGRALVEMGYVVVSPDIGQHTLQHPRASLMGERVWDALRSLDYALGLPEADRGRVAVAGLSLGGETAMYVAALDERVHVACSSGWLTTVANMKQGHCPCWNFPRLDEFFDFADIFACVAPRRLICEIGERERAPGGFPVSIARTALAEIQAAYRVLGAEDQLTLTVHPAGHVFNGRDFWPPLWKALGSPWPWSHAAGPHDAPSPDIPAGSGAGGAVTGDVWELLRRGEIARRCFVRALGVLDGWWKTRDAATGLFPRRLDQPVWAPSDNAADMLPFLAITAHALVPQRLPEVLDVLEREKALTTRTAGLPDWLSLTNRAFLYPAVDMRRLIFGAAEYCKDGLVPMTESMGPGVWTNRLVELMDALWDQAPVESAWGKLPADDAEVNGDVLQALARLYGMTRRRAYLEWAERICDAYCLEVLPKNHGLPPHRWDFTAHRATNDTLNLNDHGNELIVGLAEWFVLTQTFHPEKAAQYREPLRAMFERLLSRARNPDGLWFNALRSSTAEVLDARTPDTWGYTLSAVLSFAQAAQLPELARAAPLALQNLGRPIYLDWGDADAYADALEGALYVLNRHPEPEGFRWVERMLPLFLARQRDDGVVEGWYGDGNYARTALLVGWCFTQGIRPHPWSARLRVGAQRQGNGLVAAVECTEDWSGRLQFDLPRHRAFVGLPVDYPRLNQFPEWFTVSAQQRYTLTLGTNTPRSVLGEELARGVPVVVSPGQSLLVRVQ